MKNEGIVTSRSVERLWELVSAYLRREEPPNSARLEYPQTHNLPAEAGFSDSTLLSYLVLGTFSIGSIDLRLWRTHLKCPAENQDHIYRFD